jgi:toxin-antitoxin system PIN domain toxin
MVAIDTNILVYAHRREVKEHDQALAVVKRWAEGNERWAIPWPCLYEFYSISTNPRIWKDRASTPEQAWRQIEAWLASPSIVLLSEPEGFARVLEPLLRARVRGAVVHDARVVALCLAHGIERLVTRDRDFSLFPELSLENPFGTTEG